jgi:hypothetical protein
VATNGILAQRTIYQAELLTTQLQTYPTTWVIIEQAKGVLAERHKITTGEAFATLRNLAHTHSLLLFDPARHVAVGAPTAATVGLLGERATAASPAYVTGPDDRVDQPQASAPSEWGRFSGARRLARLPGTGAGGRQPFVGRPPQHLHLHRQLRRGPLVLGGLRPGGVQGESQPGTGQADPARIPGRLGRGNAAVRFPAPLVRKSGGRGQILAPAKQFLGPGSAHDRLRGTHRLLRGDQHLCACGPHA